MIGFLVLLCVVVLVLINVPIAVALCIASVVAMLATRVSRACPTCRSRCIRARPAFR